jgi:hypothetical protein
VLESEEKTRVRYIALAQLFELIQENYKGEERE